MKPFAIAGVQMKVFATQSNVEMMKVKLDILMNLYPWVEMVVFSELCAYGPLIHTAQEIDGPFELEMKRMAKKHGIWLLPGSIFEKRGEDVYNTATVYNPDGEVVTRYSKMFPFYPYEVGVTPGSEFCVFDVPDVGKFGVSICYDMWFPETIRTLSVMGAEVILHPRLRALLTGRLNSLLPGLQLPPISATFLILTGWNQAEAGVRSSVDRMGESFTRQILPKNSFLLK
jgi:predicted amidohydrolase